MRLQTLAPALATLVVALPSPAATLLFDFGSTGSGYSGTDSPGHEDGLATGSAWNNVGGDVASGLVDQNGVAAPGVALDFGTGTLGSISYAAATKPLTVDHAAYPHWSDDLGTDHLVRDAGDPAIALAVTGLEAGVYDFYFTAFRGDGMTATNANRNYNVRATTSTTAVTDFSGTASSTLFNNNPTTVGAWNPGDNYITGNFTVTGAGEDLYLYSNSTDFIGVMSSLEIVQVPEPASAALLAAGGLSLLARRRRA